MTAPVALTVAAMHGRLAARRRSRVVHVYTGPITPGGRTPRGARPVCNSRTRPLTILRRCGVVVDAHGRRLCANCSARLAAVARRAEQPPTNRDQRQAFWKATGIDSADLVVALAVASSVEETYAIANVTRLVYDDPVPVRRPAEPGKAQARWDFEKAIEARRDQLHTAELTPEERDARAAAREDEAMRAEQTQARHRKDTAIARAVDRRNAGKWLMPHERELLDKSA